MGSKSLGHELNATGRGTLTGKIKIEGTLGGHPLEGVVRRGDGTFSVLGTTLDHERSVETETQGEVTQATGKALGSDLTATVRRSGQRTTVRGEIGGADLRIDGESGDRDTKFAGVALGHPAVVTVVAE